MYYINAQPNETGNHGNPMGQSFPGAVGLPDALLSDYIDCKGFAHIVVESGEVVQVTVNQEALDAYEREHPEVPVEPEVTLEERMDAMEAAIRKGMDL